MYLFFPKTSASFATYIVHVICIDLV